MFLLEKLINLLENKNYAFNPNTDTYEQTTVENEIYKKIIDDVENIDKYFLSFTGLPYLQINFHNRYDTPTGIYNYPFKYYITAKEVYKVSRKKDGESEFYKTIKTSIKKFPYVSDKPYVMLFKITNECNKHLWRRDTFTKENYETYKGKLINILLLNDEKTQKEVEELTNEYNNLKKEYDTIKPLVETFFEYEKNCRPKKHKFKDIAKKDELAKYVQVEGVEENITKIKKYVLDNINQINSNDNEKIIEKIKELDKYYKKQIFSNDWYEDDNIEYADDYDVILKVKTQLGVLESHLGNQLRELNDRKTNITKFHDKFKKVLNGKNPEETLNTIITKIEKNLIPAMKMARIKGTIRNNYLGQLWFLIYQLCYKAYHNILGLNPKEKDVIFDKNFDSTAEHTLSAIFLRLGCWGMLDDGTGFIHPNEKKQCVFFGSTKKFIEYQQTLYNDWNKASKHYKDPKKQKNNQEIGKAFTLRDQLLHIKDFDFIMGKDNVFSSYRNKANIKELKKGKITHKISKYYFIQVEAKNKEFIKCDVSTFGMTSKETIFDDCICTDCSLYDNKIISNHTTYNKTKFSVFPHTDLINSSKFDTCTFNECNIINKYGIYKGCTINNSELLASKHFNECTITNTDILDISNDNKPNFYKCTFDNILFDKKNNQSTTYIDKNILKCFEECTFKNTNLSITLDLNMKSLYTFNDSFIPLYENKNKYVNCNIHLLLSIQNIGEFNVNDFNSNNLNHFLSNLFDGDFYDNVLEIINSDKKYKSIDIKKLFDEKLK